MAWKFSRTRVSPIAVDFGGDSVKLLQVVPGEPPQFFAAASVDLPESARTDLTARATFIPKAIEGMLKDQPFRGRRAICSIPAFLTLVQNFQITGADQSDFEGQIGLQLRQRLNVDPTRMVVRSLPVPAASNGQKQEVVCIAAGRDAVMRYVGIARRAKLDVVGMHCENVAIMEAFRHLYRRKGDDERTTMFIDIGALTTKVVIAHGKEIVFAKTINAAGDQFIRQYAEAHQLDFAAARQARRAAVGSAAKAAVPATAAASEPQVAVLATRAPTGFALLDAQLAAERRVASPQVTPPPSPAAEAAGEEMFSGEAIDCLIDELTLCVRYHQSLFPDRNIEKLVFLGGEARHVPLCQKIARALRIGAQLGDPLARLVRQGLSRKLPPLDLRQPQPGWAVPMGLCRSEPNL